MRNTTHENKLIHLSTNHANQIINSLNQGVHGKNPHVVNATCISFQSKKEIYSKVSENTARTHHNALLFQNGNVSKKSISKSYPILHRIKSVHKSISGSNKIAIRKINSVKIYGKKLSNSINGSSESINEGIAQEVSSLNREAIRAGQNIKLNSRIAKQYNRTDKQKEESKNHNNTVKVKSDKSPSTHNHNSKHNCHSVNSKNRKAKKTKSPAKIKQKKNPNIKKKMAQSAAGLFTKGKKSKTSSALIKSLKFALKAIKKLIFAIGSIASAFLAFIVVIGAIMMMITSPFAILLDDNPKSMRSQINSYFSEYRNEIRWRTDHALAFADITTPKDYDTRNDRTRIVGPSPDVKEVLKLYIARNEDDPDDDVLIDTEDFKIEKFKSAFRDLNKVDVTPVITNNTHEEERKKDNGDIEHVTVLDSRDIIFYQSSETALSYAIKTNMKKEQIEAIKNLGDPELNKAWTNLLYGIDSFSYLNPGSMPYFNQCDYGNVSYGPGSLASDGCGPTAFAMVVSYLTGKYITPVDILNWCGNDYYGWPDNGTAWSFFPSAAEHYGIRCEDNGADFYDAVEALKQGKVVINVQRTGIFTNGGHFIVLREITPEGKILVSDPNGGNASYRWGLSIEDYLNKLWEPEQISASGVNYWIFSSDLALGGNPAEQVWITLRSRGYSEEVVAGILGNMMAECGGQTLDLDWSIHGYFNGDTFYGLCQWCLLYTPSWFDGSSVGVQLDYLTSDIKYQFDNYGSNYQSGYCYEDFIQTDSIDEAAAAFAACYERPGYEYNNYQQRRQNAAIAYKYFHGKHYGSSY